MRAVWPGSFSPSLCAESRPGPGEGLDALGGGWGGKTLTRGVFVLLTVKSFSREGEVMQGAPALSSPSPASLRCSGEAKVLRSLYLTAVGFHLSFIELGDKNGEQNDEPLPLCSHTGCLLWFHLRLRAVVSTYSPPHFSSLCFPLQRQLL